MRAIVIGLTGLMALPAMAEDQAALAARILALSSTQTFDNYAPEIRMIATKSEVPEGEARGVQGRLVIEDCLLSAEIAVVPFGFAYPIEHVTLDLRNPHFRIEAVNTLNPSDGDSIGIINDVEDLQIRYIRIPQHTNWGNLISALKAQQIEVEATPIYAFMLIPAYGSQDQRGALVQAIAEYRAIYCTDTS